MFYQVVKIHNISNQDRIGNKIQFLQILSLVLKKNRRLNENGLINKKNKTIYLEKYLTGVKAGCINRHPLVR